MKDKIDGLQLLRLHIPSAHPKMPQHMMKALNKLMLQRCVLHVDRDEDVILMELKMAC